MVLTFHVCLSDKTLTQSVNQWPFNDYAAVPVYQSLNKAEQQENVSTHIKCWIIKDAFNAHTLICVRKYTSTHTHRHTLTKGSEMGIFKTYLCTNIDTHTHTPQVMCWQVGQDLHFPVFCIKAYQILLQKIVCQNSILWLTFKLVNQST